ncbi:MAG: hypothetical protein OEV36_01625 [Myxococcales bacterium]|nr:hypothetical protein [Myxococcales bacterium]MDH5281990.1 succinate dehydrogenase hydrophobic membrane anchor protein [Thermoleophilia bacterium]
MTEGTQSRFVAFVLIRLTALILAVLVLGHFAVTHLLTDVAETNSNFVARRWSEALWLAWDAVMLVFALVHVGSGMWLMIDERVPSRGSRRRLYAATTAGIGALGSVGIAAIAVAAIRT